MSGPILFIGCDFATGPDIGFAVVSRIHPDGRVEVLEIRETSTAPVDVIDLGLDEYAVLTTSPPCIHFTKKDAPC